MIPYFVNLLFLFAQVIPSESTAPRSAAISEALFESVSSASANANFACDYELTTGCIECEEELLRMIEPFVAEGANPNDSIPIEWIPFEKLDMDATPVEMYAGAFHGFPKRGSHFRKQDLQLIRSLPTALPTLTADSSGSGGGVLSDPSFEQLTNARMQIRYVHDGQRTSVGRVGLTARDPDEKCGFPVPMLTPISPFQECSQFGQINTEFGPHFLTLEEPRQESLIDLDTDHLVVERIWERQYEQQRIRFYSRVVFNRSFSIPVIESIDQKHCLMRDDGSDGELQNFDRVAFLDHVDCGDGIFLAKRVVRARSSLKRSKILLTEWKSSNLGERRPRDEDFVIEVKGDDDTIGFADRTLRRFTPAHLNPLGRQTPGTVIEAPPGPPKALVPRPWWLSLLIWANLIGLPLLAIYLVRRLRRTKMPHP